jgi:alpha-ribazole phosphatase
MTPQNPANQLSRKLVDTQPAQEGTTFYLVRHGETDWNLKQLFQGQRDIPLNSTGIEQARLLAHHIKRLQPKKIYTSKLSRAAETADILSADLKIEIIQDSRWNEVSFGEWEGFDYFTIQKKYPDFLARWQADPIHQSAPGGESINDLAKRVSSAAKEILKQDPDGECLIVAHGGPLQILLCLLLEMDLDKYWQFRLDNTSLTSISLYPEGPIINYLNNTSHIKAQDNLT